MELFEVTSSDVFITLGLAFSTLSIIGLIRFKTILEKQHALGLLDTLGVTNIGVGLALRSGLHLVSVKPIMLAIIILFFSAPLCYMLMQIILIYHNYLERKKHKPKKVEKNV